MTYSGSLPAEIELEPRILMVGAAPGSPEGTEISTPATLPWMAFSKLVTASSFICAPEILDIEPVISRFF